MADVSKLLFNTINDPNFLYEITPYDHEIAALDKAKKIIRAHLRETFAGDAAKRLIREHLQSTYGSLAKGYFGGSVPKVVAPKFFTQGSRAYGTLNRGPFMPPQQMDLDDGIYLTLSFIKEVVARPSIASYLFFQIVDNALKELVRIQGWKGFEEKPTCARVIISDITHIDVPMYAIPDEDVALLEAHAQQFNANLKKIDLATAWGADNWYAIPEGKVLLAHREEGWKVSDPRKIHVWFRDAVVLYGEKLRRICRYLKSWRDYHGDLDNVSSILLMTCAFMACDEIGPDDIPANEHEALLAVAKELPGYLAGEIYCIPDPTQRLDTKLSDEDRKSAIGRANVLVDKLEKTWESCFSGDLAVSNMRKVFGERFPNRPDLVKIKRDAATVYAAPRVLTPAPQITRSKSG